MPAAVLEELEHSESEFQSIINYEVLQQLWVGGEHQEGAEEPAVTQDSLLDIAGGGPVLDQRRLIWCDLMGPLPVNLGAVLRVLWWILRVLVQRNLTGGELRVAEQGIILLAYLYNLRYLVIDGILLDVLAPTIRHLAVMHVALAVFVTTPGRYSVSVRALIVVLLLLLLVVLLLLLLMLRGHHLLAILLVSPVFILKLLLVLLLCSHHFLLGHALTIVHHLLLLVHVPRAAAILVLVLHLLALFFIELLLFLALLELLLLLLFFGSRLTAVLVHARLATLELILSLQLLLLLFFFVIHNLY